MSTLLIPGQTGSEAAFDQEFFRREFKDGDVPRCDLIGDGPISIVELVLVNGATLDVNCFEEFRRGYLVATVFVDPPRCENLYRAYVRYDSIFQVNLRHHQSPERSIGFTSHVPLVDSHGAPLTPPA